MERRLGRSVEFIWAYRNRISHHHQHHLVSIPSTQQQQQSVGLGLFNVFLHSLERIKQQGKDIRNRIRIIWVYQKLDAKALMV